MTWVITEEGKKDLLRMVPSKTQAGVAKAIGVTASRLSNVFRGDPVGPKFRRLIIEAVGESAIKEVD